MCSLWTSESEFLNQPEAAFINPFASAMTAPNPAVSRSNPNEPPPVDPAVVKLNEAEDLSLLKAQKPWTLMVKRFIVPTHVQGDEEDGTVFDRVFGQDEGARWLDPARDEKVGRSGWRGSS